MANDFSLGLTDPEYIERRKINEFGFVVVFYLRVYYRSINMLAMEPD
jgi:hypothetical protein